jgi:phosphatidylserine decarboxylase
VILPPQLHYPSVETEDDFRQSLRCHTSCQSKQFPDEVVNMPVYGGQNVGIQEMDTVLQADAESETTANFSEHSRGT